MTRSPRRRSTRTDSASMSRSRSSGSSGSIAHQAALGLGDDLLGDDDHVAVDELDALGDERGQVVAAAGSRPVP